MSISVAVAQAGRILRNDGADALVPWWSFTKTLISVTALALVHDGVLRLDEPLPGHSYTLRLLLQHRAGLAEYGELREYHAAVSRDDDAWPRDVLMKRAHAERLRFEPGQGWAYSNIGYLLVRELLESVCGENLDVLFKRRLFAPLGLLEPRIALTRADLDGVMLGNVGFYDPRWVYHGLVVGRLRDAAFLLDRLMTSNFLPAHLLAEMRDGWSLQGTKANEARPWREVAYGLGIMIGTAPGGTRMIGHSGGGPGSVIAVYHHPDASPPVTVATFSPGDDIGRVELAALGSKRGV